MGKIKVVFHGKVGKGREKKRQEIQTVKVPSEKKSLLVGQLAACQCCVCGHLLEFSVCRVLALVQ